MKRIGAAIGLLVLVAAGFVFFKMNQKPPKDLDVRTERVSDGGLYSISLVPEAGVAVQGPIHTWLASLKDNAGAPVPAAKILVDGGMPQHGHGLPTQPAVTLEVSPGIYRIDGVKFSMTGWWEIKLDIDGAPGVDKVTFNIVLE